MQREHMAKAIKLFGSQKKLAKVCGVSQNTVSKWLNEYTHVSLENALKIEKASNSKIKATGFNKKFSHLLRRS